MKLCLPNGVRIAGDLLFEEDFDNQMKPQALTRDDWPTLYLPDRKNRGEYAEHTIKRPLGFR